MVKTQRDRLLFKRSPADQRPAIPTVATFRRPEGGMFKIGEAARRIGLSVSAIRLYESEGLLISFRSEAGTRWYSQADLDWIEKIQELLSRGVNFAGIRHLLAQVPCWVVKPCGAEDLAHCSMAYQSEYPCWMAPDSLCPQKLRECYRCKAYRRAKELVNLKLHARIIPNEI